LIAKVQLKHICQSGAKISARAFKITKKTFNFIQLSLQLNEYETAPYSLKLSQNMASNCLFTFVFFPHSHLNLPVLRQKLF
jgi:hypothetical protein